MPNNRTYMRKFVILTGKKTVYSKDKNPKGHVKIEVRDGKGKIFFNIEGLKPLADNKLYKGYLVSKRKDNFIIADTGAIDVKENGKGSFEGYFNPDSVYKTNHPIEDFDAILVKVSSIGEKDKEVIIPLGGFIEKGNNKLDELITSFHKETKPNKLDMENIKNIEDDSESDIYNKEDEIEEMEEAKLIKEEAKEEIEEEELIKEEAKEEIEEEELIKEEVKEEIEEEELNKEEIKEEIEEEELNKEEIKEEELEDEDFDIDKMEAEDVDEIEKEIIEEEITEEDIEEDIEEVKEVEIEENNEVIENMKDEGNYNADDILNMEESSEDSKEVEKIEKKPLVKIKVDDDYKNISEDEKEEIEDIKDDNDSNDNELKGTSIENQYINIEGKEKEYFVDEEDYEEDYEEKYEEKYRQPISREPIRNGRPNNRGYNPMNRAKNYSHQIYSYATNILKFFEEVNPFNKEFEDYTWWEIEYDKKNLYRGFLPFYNYIIGMYYPHPLMYKTTTCQSLIKKYSNYIFGIHKENDEVKYYVYGIPGEFTREEQPYRGATGFTTWLSKKDDKKLGYWIIHIDAVSGKIVNPIKPTRPS